MKQVNQLSKLFVQDLNRRMKKNLPYVAAVLFLFGVFVCLLVNHTGEVREEICREIYGFVKNR